MRLVLASQSPRRLELLQSLGLKFDCIPSHVDEKTPLADPGEIVLALSRAKAEEVALALKESGKESAGDLVVLGADTIVVLGADILNKPASREDAYSMLSRLSGKCHQVYTGVTLVKLSDFSHLEGFEVSRVVFRSLDPREIEAYIDTGEPMDKAGAYALQGTASCFVEAIEGCYTNIIGLPVPLTTALLRQAGISVLGLADNEF